MLSQGKLAGWLQLPPDAFLTWAVLNDVAFERVKLSTVEGKGVGLLAMEDLDANADDARVLLSVPRDLILSLERVHEHAKVDRDLREVLEALGDFGRSPRGAILSLLLTQASISCPELSERVGVHSPFTDYVKSLPVELLPTWYTPVELVLFSGTSLAPAMTAKMKSLIREYESLCTSARNTRWYRIVEDQLDFNDWLVVDAMYRSRALDFPGIGHCMVPCIDLANHTAGDGTVAIYEKDGDGNAVLLLRDGQEIDKGSEVTITYGDEKGACEMLFSYGFLDDDMDSAQMLFLGLPIPGSENLRTAKARVADCAPGFRLVDTDESVDWTGDFVWLLCVTEEDGLRFELARTVDGNEEMQALFGDHELTGGAAQLHALLRESELWDVYHLRAIAILQQRVYDQLQILYTTQDDIEATPYGEGESVRESVYEHAMQLRKLEFELLSKAYEFFEDKKNELVESPVVIRYLQKMNDAEPQSDPTSAEQQEDDFT